ncbi:site-2 protease family protein [Paraburkholderia hospita]|uniref:site-2 protease family protein n=1 Tax=Paraburkholderia hospita TaxID=169430 RepID=UPI0008A722E0|nr:site-2 protease family protein [Paraburkholderia hospita]SEI14739.1 hypothetical protein SAMN05192544_1025101 [Paraburkholderia hospita]
MKNRATSIRAWLVTAAVPALLIGLTLLLLALYPSQSKGIDGALTQAFRFLLIFVLLGVPYSIVHELGHAISGWWYGVPLRRIQIGSRGAFRIGHVRGAAVWVSFLPFGGRVDFWAHPVERNRRIAIYGAGVCAALLVAILAGLMIPAKYQWLRIDTVLSVVVYCLIDLFGKAPKGDWSDGEAIRGLFRYSRRS